MSLDSLINIPEYSVSEISASIKKTVESSFEYVRVRGEISGYKLAPSGHAYLSIKDEQAVLSLVCWRNNVARFKFKPEDGLEVIAIGKITTYAGQSKYQLVAEYIEPSGVGALMALFEKRKRMFEQEGLFNQDRKKEIPYLPKIIGVITSPTGAVIRDIMHRIEDRFPSRVILWPVLVQGRQAAEQISAAINGFNNLEEKGSVPKPDVIIVARGGGSIEDLWSFNEENVVRAVAKSTIPIISAVGHETDNTLIDFVADLRAPTPTGAAEFAVPVKQDLVFTISDLSKRLNYSILRLISHNQKIVEGLGRGLPRPDDILQEKIQKLDNITIRFSNSLPYYLENRENRLQLLCSKIKDPKDLVDLGFLKIKGLEDKLKIAIKFYLESNFKNLNLNQKLLESYNYKNILKRGFAVLRDDNGNLVKHADSVKKGDFLQVEFQDGKKEVVVN